MEKRAEGLTERGKFGAAEMARLGFLRRLMSIWGKGNGSATV